MDKFGGNEIGLGYIPQIQTRLDETKKKAVFIQ